MEDTGNRRHLPVHMNEMLSLVGHIPQQEISDQQENFRDLWVPCNETNLEVGNGGTK